MRILLLLMALFMAMTPARADDELLTLDGIFRQGGYAIGVVPPESRILFDGVDVTVGRDGRFLIGFHRDEAPQVQLTVFPPGEELRNYMLDIEQREYDIQHIDGLPPSSVTPPQSVLDRISAEAALVRAARAVNSYDTWFDRGWIWPVKGLISGVFGSQRVLNGEPRQPHYGIDIAVPEGTPVVAPSDGVVSLVHPDMYYSGGTLMIDHGRGLASAFLHLQSISVAEGDVVRQGDVIGTVGSTGRSTGPHLDWRINWFARRLDAAFFVPPMPD